MKCIILQKGNVFKFIDLVLKIKNFMTFFPYTSNYAMFRSQDQDKESDRYKETPTLPLISPWYSSTGKLNSTVVQFLQLCVSLFVYVFRYYLFCAVLFLFYYVILRKGFFFLFFIPVFPVVPNFGFYNQHQEFRNQGLRIVFQL